MGWQVTPTALSTRQRWQQQLDKRNGAMNGPLQERKSNVGPDEKMVAKISNKPSFAVRRVPSALWSCSPFSKRISGS